MNAASLPSQRASSIGLGAEPTADPMPSTMTANVVVNVTNQVRKIDVELLVNGEAVQLTLDPSRTLLDVLRNDLGLTGAKDGCGTGDCGACTVLLDGEPINSCLALPATLAGRSITTIEGLTTDPLGRTLQRAFVDHGAVQCGYCTPGMILAAKSLLHRSARPTEPEIRAAVAGNICRCTGYAKIVEAIQAVGAAERGE